MRDRRIKNPILPGFYSDPSICRVGEDFYMVCSSLELYPGLPVFHSKDLAHWEQLGYAMSRENGFHVEANFCAGGVMAPTIRYQDGRFYIINCNFCDRGSFIITAEHPAGPWSEPHWLTDMPGIDVSLFFDEDRKAYVVGVGEVVKRADGRMERGVWLREFDLQTMKSVGETSVIWDSALRGAAAPEAPRLYKVDGFYYLVIAEGGMEHYHAVTAARSRTLRDWYQGNPANPVMTHRQFGFDSLITNVGNADLVQTPAGEWYAVLLASRAIEGIHKNLGRETYLCPVVWERGWPVFSPKSGRIDWEYPAACGLPWTEYEKEASWDEFESQQLKMYWNFWGTPYENFWRIADSCLYLRCLKRSMREPLKAMRMGSERVYDACAAFLGRRQRHVDFDVALKMSFLPQGTESAGMIVMQAVNHQYRLERVQDEGRQLLRLALVTSDFEMMPYFPDFTGETTEQIVAQIPWEEDHVVLKLSARGQEYTFFCGKSMKEMIPFPVQGDGRRINPEKVGAMAGTMLGMFASGNGTDSNREAAFDWFWYQGKE